MGGMVTAVEVLRDKHCSHACYFSVFQTPDIIFNQPAPEGCGFQQDRKMAEKALCGFWGIPPHQAHGLNGNDPLKERSQPQDCQHLPGIIP